MLWPDYAMRAHIWAMTVSTVTPSARAEKFTRHAMAQDRPGECHDIVDRRRQPALDDGAGAGGQHEGLAGARAGTPRDPLAHDLEVGLSPGRPARTSFRMASTTLWPIGRRRTSACAAIRSVGVSACTATGMLALVVAIMISRSAVLVGIADIDLQQEAVELGFRQRIGAFLLQRVLGGEHMERLRQVVALAGDGDVPLLHRLQQRRLRARAGAVDFVGHQQLGEDRPLDEAEGAAAAIAFFEHFGAQDVGWHQVGGELDALAFHAQHDAQGLDQLGLGEARHADQKQMATRQKRNECLIDDVLLAINDLADGRAGCPQLAAQPFDVGQGCNGVGVGRGRSVGCHQGLHSVGR